MRRRASALLRTAAAVTRPARRPGEVAVRSIATAALKEITRLSAAAMRAAGAEAILTAGRLPDGELRDRTRGRLLSFRPGKGRSNEGAMDRALFKSRIAFVVATFVAGVFSRLVDRGKHFGDAARRLGHGLLQNWRLRIDDGVPFARFNLRRNFGVRDALGRIRGDLRVQRGRRLPFAALARHHGVFVFVFGVARGAPGLFDVRSEHRDHGVIGHAPLARTVVVQNVTKPKLALLH